MEKTNEFGSRVSRVLRTHRKLAALGVILAVAGVASAAYLYMSNQITSNISPTGGLTLTGAFAATYQIGASVPSDWDVTNNAGMGRFAGHRGVRTHW